MQIPHVSFVHWHTLAGLGGNSSPFHREPSIIPHRIRDQRKRERERVQGRDCSFTFCCWRSRYCNFAEIIEGLKLLPVSPISVSVNFKPDVNLRSRRTLVKPCLKSSEMAREACTVSDSLTDAHCLSMGV